MIKKIEGIINNSPFYNFLRFNHLSNGIVELLHKKTKKNIAFYKSFLGETKANQLVFDIGANKGNKVNAFEKMGFKVIALEPEKKSLETLNYRFKNNPNIEIVANGVSDTKGVLQLNVTDARSGLNTLSNKWVETLADEETNRWKNKNKFKNGYEVPVTTLAHLMEKYGIPYFIKIDVEGYEINVIKGMQTVPQFLSFESNLPEFTKETNDIILYLSNLHPNVKYQYSVDEKIVAKDWLSKDEILGLINAENHRYLEIICAFK